MVPNAPVVRKDPRTISPLLVMPFQDMSRICGTGTGVLSPLSGRAFLTGPVETGASEAVTRMLTERLEASKAFKIITMDQAQAEPYCLLPGSDQARSVADAWAAAGEKVGAKAVIGGFIFRFEGRVGSNYGVEQPASIGIAFHLLRVSDKRLLWSGYADETQQPLSEDLFKVGTFIKRGGRWVTARELAAEHIDQLLENFPYLPAPENSRAPAGAP